MIIVVIISTVEGKSVGLCLSVYLTIILLKNLL